MLISTDSGGGQIVSPRKETRFYDDIACLAADWASLDDAEARAFVRASSGAWSEAAAASYARPAVARTAMGSGITAFAAAEDARAADRESRVLTWDQVVAQAGGLR